MGSLRFHRTDCKYEVLWWRIFLFITFLNIALNFNEIEVTYIGIIILVLQSYHWYGYVISLHNIKIFFGILSNKIGMYIYMQP